MHGLQEFKNYLKFQYKKKCSIKSFQFIYPQYYGLQKYA